MRNDKKTEVGRIKSKNTSVGNKDKEIQRLIEWLLVLKIHTVDGSILYLIDSALDGKWPFGDDYKKDNANADTL